MRRLLTGISALTIVGGGAALPTTTAAAAAAWPHPGVHAAAGGSDFIVVAKGLDNPRHLSIGPDGELYVAEAGAGGPSSGAGSNCVSVTDQTGPDTACEGPTGAVAEVFADGTHKTVLTGLPSVVGENTHEVSGPADVSYTDGLLHTIVQDTDVNSTGANGFGAAGSALGQQVTAPVGASPSQWTVGPNLAAYAAAHPQSASSLGPSPTETNYDSDPYAIVPFRGGYAVADAAANALRWISPAGVISTVATFPTTGNAHMQAVPTSVAVGPDGALYVGELVGAPSTPGSADVYRVVPGESPTLFASGLTSISDLTFDQGGNLLVLEFNVNGFVDQTPNSGALIGIVRGSGKHVTLLTGLNNPTGVAFDEGIVLISNNGTSTATASTPGEIVAALDLADGYHMSAADGGLFNYGPSPFYGSLGGVKLVQPIVNTTDDPVGPGYWMVAHDGGVFSFGDASFFGSTGGMRLDAPIVGMSSTPDGRGYWLVAADGGVFSFGDATFHGSLGGVALAQPIVGMASTGDGGGYWMVASDGGVFAFGDAPFLGSTGGIKLAAPIVGMAPTKDDSGYWLVAADGGVFNYGDAPFRGSAGGHKLNAPVVAMAGDPLDSGYWLFASDGGVFNYGDAAFLGSAAGAKLVQPVVAAAAP